MKKAYLFAATLLIGGLIILEQSGVFLSPSGRESAGNISSAIVMKSSPTLIKTTTTTVTEPVKTVLPVDSTTTTITPVTTDAATTFTPAATDTSTLPAPDSTGTFTPAPETADTAPPPETATTIAPETTVSAPPPEELPAATVPTEPPPEPAKTTSTPPPAPPPEPEPAPPPATATTTAAPATTTTKSTKPAAKPSYRTTTIKPATTATKAEPEPAVQTSSMLLDSDEDCFADRMEISLGTDPVKADSHPRDENKNCVDDAWEDKYGFIPGSGMLDSDLDGLSDKLEYLYGTEPLNKDTDGDTFGDGREILDLRTDPHDNADPGTIEKIGIRVTSFADGQSTSDPRPMIKGVAPVGKEVEIRVTDSKKKETVLGRAMTGENNMFILRPEKELKDGDYSVISRTTAKDGPASQERGATGFKAANASDILQKAEAAAQPEEQMESAPVSIKVKKALAVTPPDPEKLADVPVTEDNLLKDLRVEIIDNRPVLIGKTAYNCEVIATWNSIVLTSAIIADSPAGEFTISPFDTLAPGDHEVHLTAVRPKDDASSETISLPFTIKTEDYRELAIETGEPGSSAENDARENASGLKGAAETAQTGGFPWFAVIIAALAAAGGGAYYIVRRKK